MALSSAWVAAQSAPGKALTIVVGFPPGAAPDLMARTIGEKLAPRIGMPVVVENKVGGSGLVAAAAVARGPADGSTLLIAPNTLAIAPHVLPKGVAGSIDVQRDLTPVLLLGTSPMLMLANPQLGAKTLDEFVTLVRKQPDTSYGSAGNGTPMHFAGEMLNAAMNLKLNHIPYRGSAPLVVAGIGGEVKLIFVGLGAVTGQIKAGQLLPLAVTESARSKLLPDVPTLAEAGVKGVDVNAWFGLFAPKGASQDMVTRVAADIEAVLKMPDVMARLAAAGVEVAPAPAATLAKTMAHDHERYGKVARDLKITAD